MPRASLGAAFALAILAVGTAPMAAQRPGQAPGIDSSLYVRTSAPTNPIIQQMYTEGTQHGQAMSLAQVLMDSIGPRLTNSDRFDAGQNWLIGKYNSWGINAKQVQYGTWMKWVRGATHLDLVQPRVKTLEATTLGWSPNTNGKWVEAEVVLLPKTEAEWAAWAPTARGKFVLGSAAQPSCRMPAQVNQFGTEETIARIDQERKDWATDYRARMALGGNPKVWPKELGVAGVLTNTWSNYPGIDKVFGSPKDASNVPTLDVSCEDYNLLYRLAQNNQSPKVRLFAESQNLGEQPVHNVIATIPGTEKPNEYIVFSAHYDSWDGGTGATDNGTGTITMMEAARILKKIYPNPKRTIIIGHWGGEEQGLNGSRSWVADNPAIVGQIHAGFNQDNGTGRIVSASPGPFPAGIEALVRYLHELPSSMTGRIRMGGTGNPATGGSDHASFQCMKAPVYSLGALNWDYFSTTWHTNRDTYDKVIAEDLQDNATLVAMLAYMADQDPALLSHDVIQPTDRRTGQNVEWPSCGTGDRNTASSPR